ncbi:unnamed protein product [Trichogramma brassicae]|uniref:Uncharacterized protein n=1 Tax=Trichogramma brassicae TaxID=86971 RepID=A0A6H5IZY5_9HYME|nr:unnamed protein product [Trichogramma brassicae]
MLIELNRILRIIVKFYLYKEMNVLVLKICNLHLNATLEKSVPSINLTDFDFSNCLKIVVDASSPTKVIAEPEFRPSASSEPPGIIFVQKHRDFPKKVIAEPEFRPSASSEPPGIIFVQKHRDFPKKVIAEPEFQPSASSESPGTVFLQKHRDFPKKVIAEPEFRPSASSESPGTVFLQKHRDFPKKAIAEPEFRPSASSESPGTLESGIENLKEVFAELGPERTRGATHKASIGGGTNSCFTGAICGTTIEAAIVAVIITSLRGFPRRAWLEKLDSTRCRLGPRDRQHQFRVSSTAIVFHRREAVLEFAAAAATTSQYHAVRVRTIKLRDLCHACYIHIHLIYMLVGCERTRSCTASESCKPLDQESSGLQKSRALARPDIHGVHSDSFGCDVCEIYTNLRRTHTRALISSVASRGSPELSASGKTNVEATLLRSQQSTTLTIEDTIDVEQRDNDGIQNRIIYEDSNESFEDDAVSEHNEHSHEDDWEMEAPDDFNRFTEETKRAGEIAIGPSDTTILDVCRAVPEQRYNLLLTATKRLVIDEEHAHY